MAAKTTYIYRVELSNDKDFETKYCYARNASVVKEAYRELCKRKKYNKVVTVPFGDADILRHPGPFEELPKDEIAYLLSNNIGSASRYSNRKDNRLPEGTFVSKDQIGDVI